MALSTITYSNKSDINANSSVPVANKVQASDMNEIKSVVNAGINQVNGISGQILWTNNSPSASFSSQSITLSSNNYDLLVWIFKRNNSTDYMTSPVFVVKTFDGIATTVDSSGNTVRRGISYTDMTTYALADASSTAVDNSYLIPLYVVGYNTGLWS